MTEELDRLRERGNMRFGFCLPTFAWPGPRLFRTPNVESVDAADIMKMAREAEALKFDSIWSCDHLMLGRDNSVLEGWTLLSAVTGITTTPKLGLIHEANLPRPPAVHAKMTGTLDQLSNGRFIFFFDSGTSGGESLAYGLDWDDDPAVRLAQLTEAVALVKLLWTATGPVDFEGRFYKVHQAEAAPRPVQTPHPPIWFGGASPGVLELCAREGDGWNSVPVRLAELRRQLQLLDDACHAVGRRPADLERSFETQILIAEDRSGVRDLLARLLSRPEHRSGPARDDGDLSALLSGFLTGASDDLPPEIADSWLIGTPDEIESRIRQLRDIGIDHLLLWFMDSPDRTGMRLFMEQVASRF